MHWRMDRCLSTLSSQKRAFSLCEVSSTHLTHRQHFVKVIHRFQKVNHSNICFVYGYANVCLYISTATFLCIKLGPAAGDLKW